MDGSKKSLQDRLVVGAIIEVETVRAMVVRVDARRS